MGLLNISKLLDYYRPILKDQVIYRNIACVFVVLVSQLNKMPLATCF